MADQITGLRDILRYFNRAESHSDNDKLHVSKEELCTAKGKISEAADAVIDAIVSDDATYKALRAVQAEGWFNHRQVSLQDLHAAVGGAGPKGEPATSAREAFLLRLHNTTEKLTQRERNRAVVDAANDVFKKAAGGGETAAILSLAHAGSGKPIAELNAAYKEADNTSEPGAGLALGSAISGRTIDEMNALYGGARGESYEVSSILAIAAAASGQSIEQMNRLYAKAEGGEGPAALLAAGAAISGKSIQEMNRLFKSAAGGWERGALLALAAALTDKPIAEINKTCAQAAGDRERPAMLTLASVVAGKPIGEINQMYESAAGGARPAAILVMAMVAKSGKLPPRMVAALGVAAVSSVIDRP